ncbi:Zinc finger, RING/FYVE/PHD-type [Artemisia annua]|uniref:Zinc finger, RING/FYVE/PHD-type n=1 Tax=Artemisia annua TaxID=35608 RepID=A0A2U1NJM9_ARTAN|nr:Zinc finger, RING/FYVE/PHD-type [Artemisia annua]
MDVVGGTLGAAGGAIFGFKNKMNILKYFIAGAVTGAVWSYRITWATFDYFLQCDHEDERGFFLHLEVASCEKVNCEKVIKLPKIEISNYNVCDASGNTTCCSICLQDFEVGDAAGVFPKCGHKYHPQCISQWLTSHNSCPAWKTWRNGTTVNMIDPILKAGSSSLHSIIRSIHIGLLCVQEKVNDRPTMASVVLMLNSFAVTLPVPSEPAFFLHSNTDPEIPLLSEYSSSTSSSGLEKHKPLKSR